MELWIPWMKAVWALRPSCSRLRTFLWMTLSLAAASIRTDPCGVTSFVRALGLQADCYDRLLDLFHSPALNLDSLTRLWVKLVLRIHPQVLRERGRLLLVGDGLKIPKEGKKMPAVKCLHQESDTNNKAEYIMGHSCQAVALLVGALASVFAVPLAARIHEGVVFSNRDSRTLLDKMVLLVESLGLLDPFYFIADAYYASRTVIRPLLKKGNHLVTRVRSNAVAYRPAAPSPGKKKRGRPQLYGTKLKLRTLLEDSDTLQEAPSPVYGEQGVQIRFRCVDLLWRPVGALVRFVAVLHPHRGQAILMATDPTLPALDIIRLYGWRFKIEVSFKAALRVLGAYAYHFWMRAMTPIRRRSGNQYLHRKSDVYRDAVRRKLSAYHRHIQLGLIAQGLLQYLSATFPKRVWARFGSWIRTIRPGIPPSEQVTAIALRNTLPEFLADSRSEPILKKFLGERIDLERSEGLRLAG